MGRSNLVVFSVILFLCFFGRANADTIYFSNYINPEHLSVLKADLTSKLISKKDISWLTERVHYIASASENDFGSREKILSTTYKYPPFASGDMSNLSAILYLAGKQSGVLYGYRFETGRSRLELAVTSPRVGIIQIKPSLFEPIGTVSQNTLGARINRIATFFHEARHSDGHGANVGFPHSVCPENHVLKGRQACDAYSNGAYAIQAQKLKILRQRCTELNTCSRSDIALLSVAALEAKSRVVGTRSVSAKPEGEIQ